MFKFLRGEKTSVQSLTVLEVIFASTSGMDLAGVEEDAGAGEGRGVGQRKGNRNKMELEGYKFCFFFATVLTTHQAIIFRVTSVIRRLKYAK